MAEIRKGENKIQKTNIEWARNPDGTPGFTSNPFTGCRNGCPYCYARREAYGRCKQADMAGIPVSHSQGREDREDPFAPRYHPDRLLEIEKRKKPAGIFLCNRSDLFGDYWPQIWQDRIFKMIRACPQHRFYLLTKQAARLVAFSPFPDNCYVGVTATDYLKYVDACNYLSQVEAKVKYLSIEPLLSWDKAVAYFFESGGINQVIIGAQSRPTILPKWAWVREIIEAADKAGVPIFLKDNLGLNKYDSVGATPYYKTHSSGTMELRQEFPG